MIEGHCDGQTDRRTDRTVKLCCKNSDKLKLCWRQCEESTCTEHTVDTLWLRRKANPVTTSTIHNHNTKYICDQTLLTEPLFVQKFSLQEFY